MLILLLDAYNLLYRSFVTLPVAITDQSGRPINAVYGMISATLRLQSDVQPDRILAAFDTPEVPTFRHELYAGYQGHRGPLGGDQAEEFARQVRLAQAGLPAVGITAAALPRFEADDIIGSVAREAQEAGDRAIIVSTDRDMLQLVRPGVEVLVPGSRAARYATAESVRDRMGVDPEFVTTLKALAGDSSDNIPGVQGIGSKTAVHLIERFGSLESIYAAMHELPARPAAALQRQRDEAFLFRQVVTIVQNLSLDAWREPSTSPPIAPGSRVREVIDVMLGDT
ncbi:MAG TPA: 5'-3' exonuclease [Chloroflexota bacterium]